ncbi:MAG: 4'-phosphopantetheinyl transferase superfamily protein [Desulforegulaceae bacterium]|nr:4'-phosphopantetheinyl transferase superfamily protein [Desulforegulaceae bacterium]
MNLKRFIAFSGKIYQETEICIIDIYKLFKVYNSQFLKHSSFFSKPTKIKAADFYFLGNFFSAREIKTINGFKTIKKQFEWMSARIGIKNLVKNKYPHLSFRSIETEKDIYGAPLIKNLPFLNISISHSGKYAVSAINEKQRIGIDLEELKCLNTKYLLYAGFSKKEKKLTCPENYFEILKLWTIKESYLKYIKKGFNESLKKVEIIKNKIYHNGVPIKNVCTESFFLLENYVVSFVYENNI